MDSTLGNANSLKWGMTDQILIGSGYARDVMELKLWWVGETAVGFGYVEYPGAPPSRIAVTFEAGTGLRYNFWTERWRPFTSLMLEVMSIFNTKKPVPFPYFFNYVSVPTFVALRPSLGLEWIFGEDMGIEIEAGYLLMSNFENPARHSVILRSAYRLYF